MDPRLLYWSAALLDLGLVVALAGLGVRHRRRGDVPRHARNMKAAGAGVALFLVSYPLKLLLLGGEHSERWGTFDVAVLRFHESCVLVMLLGGGLAGQRALRLARTRNATRDPADPPAPAALARWHRRAGWAAVVASGLAFASAALVLAGMYRRAGLL